MNGGLPALTEGKNEASNLEYIIKHVFLLPKLPQKNDSAPERDASLLIACEEALDSFKNYFHAAELRKWLICKKMVQDMLKSRGPSGAFRQEEIERLLGTIGDEDVLSFQLRAQNAGLVLRKWKNRVVFEMFELSATAEATMSTEGRLIRCFPGPTIAINSLKLTDPLFRKAIAEFIVDLDTETAEECRPKARKAQSDESEVRDSVHPKLVTELLAGMLRGIGEPADTTRIHKRIRDDVLWNNTFKPWRRSSLWILLRVALQSTLTTDGDNRNILYKCFMIFLMAQLTSQYLESSFESDTLFIMAAKIGRRTFKLGVDHKTSKMRSVLAIVKAAHQKLAEIWQRTENLKSECQPLHEWKASGCDTVNSTRLSLLNFMPYYQSIWSRVSKPTSRQEFDPKCHNRIAQQMYLPKIDADSSSEHLRLTLMDIERWVQLNLVNWLDQNHNSQTSCHDLAKVMQDYWALASSAYDENPEDLSLMFLTLIDLWIALDKCANFQYPIIGDYGPGFPDSLFNPLLLPRKDQMMRLQHVEDYIKQRNKRASYSSSFVFRNINNKNSLGVRFFEDSKHHQNLRHRIEESAKVMQSQKREEFERKNQEYDNLMEKSNSSGCNCLWTKRRRLRQDSPYCSHCDYRRRAERLSIEVAEWPLPCTDLEAKSTTFELDIPRTISIWRETTYALHVDVFSPKGEKTSLNGSNLYSLNGYRQLKPFFKSEPARLQLTSSSKPFVISHYGNRKFPVAKDVDLCVKNGLHYSLYDSVSSNWTDDLLSELDIQKRCTFSLPSGLYQPLQYSLDGTYHTSNMAIAKQSDCPSGLNLHEYYSFVSLRSGYRLQWRNILCELSNGSLRLEHDEVYMLIVQTAWQAGCSNDKFWRRSHEDLQEEQFGISLTMALEEAISTVEGNWQGANAVRIFNVVATRLLSMSPHNTVRGLCCKFLKRARQISLSWTRDVAGLLQNERDEQRMKDYNLHLIELALTCHSTFDVDNKNIDSVLGSEEAVTMLIECCTIIHDRCPPTPDGLPTKLCQLFRRYEIRSHLLEDEVRRQILRNQSSIDNAIGKMWLNYQRGSPWTSLSRPKERWLQTVSGHMTVHYNVLNGSLLINGLPLARLPQEYERHRTYRRLFGNKVLEVIPSSMEGMLFEVRNDFFGQRIYFNMLDSELIVRSQRDGKIFELIPNHTLQGDFPTVLLEEYVHWLDVETKVIEWRSLTEPWSSPSQTWRLISDHEHYYLQSGDRELIDVRSHTAKYITRIFEPLEIPSHVQISIVATDMLDINLPRLNLDFFVKQSENRIRSKQFRGMVIDERQCFGSLTGLINKLVLQEIDGNSRSVLIPYGEVQFEKEGQHVRVSILTPLSSKLIDYYVYAIDDQLGRLVDGGSLHGRLFRLYIHALTSYCLPDRLTGRTGTEEALMGLRGGATNSFLELESREQDILKLIARLTPKRCYYPSHLEKMQQTQWLPLPSLSQHYGFYQQVMQILSQAEKLRVFQENLSPTPLLEDCGHSKLNRRAAIRESSFRLYGFGGEVFNIEQDYLYSSRDHEIDINRELEAYKISRLVENYSMNLKPNFSLLEEIMSWDKVICGSGSLPKIGFDPLWLSKPSDTFPEYFCGLLEYFQNCSMERVKYQIMILLATLSYSFDARRGLVQVLFAFATVPALRQEHITHQPSYNLADGYEPARQTLIEVTGKHAQPFSSSPEFHLPILPNEDESDAHTRRLNKYADSKKSNISLFVEELLVQWPCVDIHEPHTSSYTTYIAIDAAMADCRRNFESWFRNSSFKAKIVKMQDVLINLGSDLVSPHIYIAPSVVDEYCFTKRCLSLANLMDRSSPPRLPAFPRDVFDNWIIDKDNDDNDVELLNALLKDMSSNVSTPHEQKYIKDLQGSSKAFGQGQNTELHLPAYYRETLKKWLEEASDFSIVIYNKIYDRLRSGSHVIFREAGMIPRMSPISLLMFLASNKVDLICQTWKLALIHYAKAIALVQRAERLLACGDSVDLTSEIKNTGHHNWDPATYPEWLLMELENNMLIREDQALVAQQMMYPSTGRNSVLQLNMGQGKSSVIVPAIAAALANGINIVRVIVLKPLARQMLHILISKLGGMLNRRVLYLPVSRSMRVDINKADKIRAVYNECQRTGSVLLLQPEHILSFELMGLEYCLSQNSDVSKLLLATQSWLDNFSRDILDESDEILNVQFELIYTIGLQRAIEFSPDRWHVIQNVLDIVCKTVPTIDRLHPHGLEIKNVRHGAFPQVRILKPIVGDTLFQLVARQICTDGLKGLKVWHLSEEDKMSLCTYLLSSRSTPYDAAILRSSESYIEASTLLLLKGLINGILTFAFSHKRWRVNYGLDLSRSLLAVPYHAKDIPAPRAEFSHPEVTIVLTCLSYYYGGLTDEQIYASFKALLTSDQAPEIYGHWVKDAVDLPVPFRNIRGINLKNEVQCAREVFPSLRFAKSLINYYLSEIVFPAEMREFPSKLSSSGWDIARVKANPITGFSGTNDSRYMLPLSIEQSDLPGQLSTNASVLNCLLRSENSFIDIHGKSGKCMLNVDNLLKATVKQRKKVRVILDVGAQIVEMRNEEVALSWLSRVPDSQAQAAVFFNDDNELCVITRDRRKEILQTSSFAKLLDQCLIYLDEAHTRGTDLNLPTNYRALVTLGPNLSKDRLVQACMRMRKLGKGQSVLFCCSKEVERSIRDLMKINRQTNVIEVADILRWSIINTCVHTSNSIPLWATQGIRHQNRLAEFAQVSGDISINTVEALLEPEAQTLKKRYAPSEVDAYQMFRDIKEIAFKHRREQVEAIQARCNDFQCKTRQGAVLQEEQERELSPENEKEQQVELPAPHPPLEHSVHEDVRHFVRDGILISSSEAFRPAFDIFRKTTADTWYEMNAWSHNLLVTNDFAHSIQGKPGQPMDLFLKPVHWILSNYSGNRCIVISPYEAHNLMPLIRESNHVTLYPYRARHSISAPLLPQFSQCMIPFTSEFNGLEPQLARQLDLFAGQLFFGSYSDYESFCEFLGIASQPPIDGISVERDGFINPESRAKLSSQLLRNCMFKTSPINFVRLVVAMRRKGLSHLESHMGKILNGELIPKDQFEKD